MAAGPIDRLRQKGSQGAVNIANMSPEEQQAFLMQNFASLAQQLGSAQTSTTTENPYDAALAEFGGHIGLQPRAFLQHGVGPRAPLAAPQEGYIVSPTGKILYNNGAIADPASGVIFPVNDPSVEGSEAWLRDIQDKWSKGQANSWRKRLAKQGYEVAESGGWATDLLSALRTYHQNRYLNYGKVVPLVPRDAISRESIRKQIDFQALKEEIKGWGEVPFSEELDEDTAEFFAEKNLNVAMRLARKHPTWSMEQVMAGAEMRTQKQFIKEPGVRSALREAEEDEMDETLLNDVISVSQLGSVR